VEGVQGGTRREGSNNYFYWHLKQAFIRWVNGPAAANFETRLRVLVQSSSLILFEKHDSLPQT
jgi:hypothetical protein